MTPQSINIQSITLASDGVSVIVTYNVPSDLDQNGNPSVYTVQFPSADAPDQTDVIAQDNYTYYESLITGL